MAPWSAARCVEQLSPDKAAAFTHAMPYQDATSLLRLLDDSGFEQILDGLPKGLAKDFRNSLTYPKGTVGAYMDHSVPTFRDNSSVADALKYAKKPRSEAGSHIIVVGDEGRFAGLVGIAQLLRSSTEAPLSEVMTPGLRPLSNRATLVSVAARPEWDDYTSLPVVGRKSNVLGVLSRSALKKALAEDRIVPASFVSSALWMHLIQSYLVVAASLLRLLSYAEANKARAPIQDKAHARKRRQSN